MNGKEYFLYIDLHKEENIKDSINYKDKFIAPGHLQWQSVNNSSQHTERGQDLVRNKQRGENLHLFVRKYKEIDKGKTEPYIYIGKGNSIQYEGNKPITVILELENKIPPVLNTELTEKV